MSDPTATDPTATTSSAHHSAPLAVTTVVELSARSVLVVLLIAIAFLASAHAVRFRLMQSWPTPDLFQGEALRIFSIGGESALVTWVTIIMMLAVALVAVLIGLGERAAGARAWRQWIGVALVFLLASLDEQVQLHEMFVEPVRALFSITTGPFLLAWVIPAIVLAAILAVLFLPFVTRLPARTRLWLIAAIGLWLAGAIGMEMVDSATFEWRQAMPEDQSRWISAVMYTTEESMEMLGIAVLLHTLLVHARDHNPGALGANLRVV